MLVPRLQDPTRPAVEAYLGEAEPENLRLHCQRRILELEVDHQLRLAQRIIVLESPSQLYEVVEHWSADMSAWPGDLALVNQLALTLHFN